MSASNRRVLPALVVAITLGIGILIGTVVSRGVRAAKGASGAADARPLPMPSPVDLSNSFSQIADKVEDAVVNINTDTTVRISRRNPHAPEDSPFNDFFDHFFQGGPEGPSGGDGGFRQQSLGSGVILDKNGYILTNFHVITQAESDKPVDRITVSLHGDDAKYKAQVVGSDRWTDLAIIKIEAGKPLHAAELGNSDSMRVGDWVLAVGSPFGLDSTVTAGIVSAKGRDIEGGTEGQFKRFLQTDAAINPGNSGGPLVNLAGQVIGINTAIATRRGSYDGVGFAIPSNTARKVYNAIVMNGSVKRGAIGVQFQAQPNAALLRGFGADHGIVVDSVQPGSPADHAGLKRGDVIQSVNGQAVRSGDELVAIVSDTDIGKKLHVEYLREGKRAVADVEVADRNEIIGENRASQGGEGNPETGPQGEGVLGLGVKNLSPDQAQELSSQLHLEAKQGVLVTDVQVSGFASDLGVERSDIIISINKKSLASVEEYNKLQSQLHSGEDVVLLVARRTGPRSFTTLFLADRLP
ncbi:MAG TPA: Do family serine endopeptidase [Terriglobia bacterium]|nr:Do family serine endopeptidase [Terriglobia bacterium]